MTKQDYDIAIEEIMVAGKLFMENNNEESFERYRTRKNKLWNIISSKLEPQVMQKIAGIKKEYENIIGKQLGSDDKDDWDKVIYIDFEGLWSWIEEKLKSNFSA